jgi:hypothetical protein
MITAKKLLERLFNYLFVNQFICCIFELWQLSQRGICLLHIKLEIMTEQRLKELQEGMSNDSLIKEVERQITELARTGGKSHRMCVPPMPEDTDMILSELVRRYKRALTNER